MTSTSFKIFIFFLFLSSSCGLFSQTEFRTFNYANGAVASEGLLTDGKPDGYWKTFYENGQLKSAGNRKNFLLDSTWVFFSNSGDTTLIVNYKSGLKNGKRITFLSDEIQEDPFVADLKSGLGKRYDRKYRLLQLIHFKDGFEEGFSPCYDTNGVLVEMLKYKKGFIVGREELNRCDDKGRKHGYWKTFYDDLSVRTEGYYSHGLKDGFFKEYDPKANLVKITKFVNGVEQIIESELMPLEVRHEYHSNGKMKKEASFRDGKPEGLWRVFDENGKVVASQRFKNGIMMEQGITEVDGKRQGEWKQFYQDSTLKAEGSYLDDNKNGEWHFYYPGGKLEQIGSYKDGEPDGDWFWYYENGNILRQESYYLGYHEGEYKEYDASGKVIVSGNYFDNLKSGKWTVEIGEIKTQGEYINDGKNGEWISYYDNGNIAFKGTYKSGYPVGQHFYYYSNGNIREIQSYSGGIKNGDWKKYLDNGELFFTVTYEQGVEKKYDGETLDDEDLIIEESETDE